MSKCPAEYLADYQRLAEAHGGALLSDRWLGANTRMRFRCAEGHEWEVTAASARRGTWCARCNGRTRYTIDDMHTLAAERGGECLSQEYGGTLTKLRWRCGLGHEWDTTPNTILGGSWCRRCGLGQLDIESMHKAARANGGECLSATYTNKDTKLEWRCAEGHTWSATPGHVLNSGSWCPRCAGKIVTLNDIRQDAIDRGGECLSSAYRGSGVKLRFRCGEGHEFSTRPSELRAGSWCPVCAGTMRRTLADMHTAAAERGGLCLSEAYHNISTKLRWRCAKGHEWEATPLHVLHSRSWCPRCVGVVTVEEMRDLAAQQGGRLMSTQVGKSRARLAFECAEGHAFERTPDAARKGRWCPLCYPRGTDWPRGGSVMPS